MSYNGKMIGRRVDYSSMSKLPNIDKMFDVLGATQREMGMESSVQEASYDKQGKKINRFKRSVNGVIDTRTGELLDKEKPKVFPVIPSYDDITGKPVRKIKNDKKHETPKQISQSEPVKESKKSKRLSLAQMGFEGFYNKTFGIVDSDDDDDLYVCDYCTDLGFSEKYKPYICDNCTKCESCSDFSSGSCDGCSYSKTRNGRLYSEQLTKDQIIDSDDLELLEESDEDPTKRKPTGKFSTLNY